MSTQRAVAAAVVAGAGIVYLTPLTWREVLHWAAVGITVAAAAVVVAYLVPHAKRLVEWASS